MNLPNYFKWERLLGDRDYSGMASLPLSKMFIFYALDRMHAEGVENEVAWHGLTKKLESMPMNNWERLELSLACPLKKMSSSEVDSILERVVNSAKQKNHDKTIVHVHVPKAAGTSVNTAFRERYYDKKVSLPGNNTPLALRLTFNRLAGHVPFLSTGHLPLNWLLGEGVGRGNCQFFMVHRNHNDRINSMRNQVVSSVLAGNFFNRPYAYYKQFYIREMLNKYFFPVGNEFLINTMSASLSVDIEDAPGVLQNNHVEVVGFEKLTLYLKERFDIELHHGKKNRTRNVSKYMCQIPSSFYAVDSANFK